jgi:hypothetical protein
MGEKTQPEEAGNEDFAILPEKRNDAELLDGSMCSR